MKIDGIPNSPAVGLASAKPAAHDGEPFAKSLANSLSEVNELQSVADTKVEQLATGEIENVQDDVLAVAEADLSFRLVLEIRNRLVESYQEIMRLQV
jgi:flagellar hook-basal body complex protein FliE